MRVLVPLARRVRERHGRDAHHAPGRRSKIFDVEIERRAAGYDEREISDGDARRRARVVVGEHHVARWQRGQCHVRRNRGRRGVLETQVVDGVIGAPVGVHCIVLCFDEIANADVECSGVVGARSVTLRRPAKRHHEATEPCVREVGHRARRGEHARAAVRSLVRWRAARRRARVRCVGRGVARARVGFCLLRRATSHRESRRRKSKMLHPSSTPRFAHRRKRINRVSVARADGVHRKAK